MKLENLLLDKRCCLVKLCDLALKHQDEGGAQEADSLAWSQADQPSYLRAPLCPGSVEGCRRKTAVAHHAVVPVWCQSGDVAQAECFSAPRHSARPA